MNRTPLPTQPQRALGTSGGRRAALRAAATWLPLVAATLLAAWPHPSAQAQTPTQGGCGDPFKNHFGPWDFRTARREDIQIVERVHFTPGIESMTKPVNTAMYDMAQDVAYTLRVFPNHHRALLTMQRLSEKHRADPPAGAGYSVECWYERATRFRPDDPVVRGLYAQWLGRKGRQEEADRQLQQALRHGKDSPLTQYNVGLVYFAIGMHDRALAQAHKAMAMGVPRTELVDMLKREGKWQDPAP